MMVENMEYWLTMAIWLWVTAPCLAPDERPNEQTSLNCWDVHRRVNLHCANWSWPTQTHTPSMAKTPRKDEQPAAA